LSNFAAKSDHGYAVVDFDNVTERGLKKLIAALKRAGSPVVDVEATNKKSRRDGLFVKKAKLYFENGQSMTLFVGDQGDVYQMTLNATKQPIPSVKNHTGLAKEMHRLMVRNQKKFDKAQARKAKAALKDTSGIKPASRSIAKRIEEVNASLAVAQENNSTVSNQLALMNNELEQQRATISELETTLKAEKQETKDLESQIKEQG
jgi:hypothetical protein